MAEVAERDIRVDDPDRPIGKAFKPGQVSIQADPDQASIIFIGKNIYLQTLLMLTNNGCDLD